MTVCLVGEGHGRVGDAFLGAAEAEHLVVGVDGDAEARAACKPATAFLNSGVPSKGG